MSDPVDSPYVLVVDDDPDVRFLISDVLEAMDVDFKVAENGQEALRLVNETRPSLIVLDIMMPVMDGLTFITRLQRDSQNKKIPLILLSAIADNQPHMAGLPGVIAVLRKGNLSLKSLAGLIGQAMGVDSDVF